MAKKIKQKAALVTGGAGGIGLGIAKELSDNGFIIVVADICPVPAGKEAAASLSEGSMFIRANITSGKDRQKILNTIKTKLTDNTPV